jgi:hypothetical protein
VVPPYVIAKNECTTTRGCATNRGFTVILTFRVRNNEKNPGKTPETQKMRNTQKLKEFPL